jgi:hypothetical protein
MKLELFMRGYKELDEQERTSKDLRPVTFLSIFQIEDGNDGRFSNRRDAIEPPSLQNGTSSRRDLGGSVDVGDGDA